MQRLTTREDLLYGFSMVIHPCCGSFIVVVGVCIWRLEYSMSNGVTRIERLCIDAVGVACHRVQ
eukprot:m.1498428 g.1498428  ORF g.1498428 m.1498428 type:complete len:64 (+) comp25203_c0_seq4:141-332(+)